ncbi:high-affinity choline transporter 1 isoform X2 [Apis mellifera]|uniref:High-affinity choline transporter 1 isoform X2 n=1 Tax=Apis mellifera TaxID=7460 RepID=A0A7M7MKH0_APIME|nr:high-affinity choline transporter 1 isoform X2 [Apis mellifera]|eukprot:XP_026296482.1 high-affinity choline transporter 1 isoform X2 [Apis mellifera]
MGVYVIGLVGVIAFYVAVLGVGIWAAAVKKKKSRHGHDALILANRGLGPILGVFTLIATWVGGAYINGTAELMFTKGLAWCQVPFGYSLSLLFGAVLFVRPMRKAEHVTMLDPFQERYGAGVGGLLFLPALFSDLFWCGGVLRALGSSLAVVAGVNPDISIVASALLAAVYTVFGGLYSVACTDALQLACIVIGLGLAAPFSVLHPAVNFEKNLTPHEWLGEIKNEDLGEWVDCMLLLVFGGIPWQGYFQRILSMRSTSMATALSITSMFGCMILAFPSALIGVVARATDWSTVQGFNKSIIAHEANAALPIVLRYLTPQWVSFVGLGAISAAVMSSADSSILASSSMFSRNVYRLTLRPKASERELNWILRISVLVITVLSTVIALTVDSVYYLSYLASDLVYVVLFPQLLTVVHWPSLVDTYGCLAGYFVAVVLRLCGGEKGLGVPALIEYPFYDVETQSQKFPFRTGAMLVALCTQLVTSFFTRNLLGKGYFPRCCDVLSVYSPGKSKDQSGVVQSSSGAALMDTSSVNKSTSGIDSCDGIGPGSYDDDRTTTNSVEDVTDQRDNGTIASDLYEKETPKKHINSIGTAAQKANQSLQHLQTLRNSIHASSISGRHTPTPNQYAPIQSNEVSRGQILGVRNLRGSMGQMLLPTDRPPIIAPCNNPAMINVPTNSTMVTPVTPDAHYAKIEEPASLVNDKTRENERHGVVDRGVTEFQTVPDNMLTTINVKKNVKGVKLVGMEGGTLRRPSLQGTFSPTPSVELVHILDRRQSSGSYGPGSLSPVPMGVEACKTHGTALEGQGGNEHCRIKRGIVRHHSFNDTGDRALTTLARQPTYPSMPLRSEDCRMTLVKKDRRTSTIARHGSMTNEKELSGCMTGLVVCSPTYNMYSSAVKNSNYFVTDDEAVSRF